MLVGPLGSLDYSPPVAALPAACAWAATTQRVTPAALYACPLRPAALQIQIQ